MILVETDRFAFVNNVDELDTDIVTRIQIREVEFTTDITPSDFLVLKGKWFLSIINGIVDYRGDHTLKGEIHLSGSDLIVNYDPDTNLLENEIGFKIVVHGHYDGIDLSLLDKLIPTNRRSTHFLESIGMLPLSQIRLPGSTISYLTNTDVLGIKSDYLAVYDMVPYLAINPKSSKGYSLFVDPTMLDYFVDADGVMISYDPLIEGIKRSGNLDYADYEDTILKSFLSGWDIAEESAIEGCIRYRSISSYAEQEVLNSLRKFRTIDNSSYALFKKFDVPISNSIKREATIRSLRSNQVLNTTDEIELASIKTVLTTYEELVKVLINPILVTDTITSLFIGRNVMVECSGGLDQLLLDFSNFYNISKTDAVQAIADSYIMRLEDLCKEGGDFHLLNRKITPQTIQDNITSWLSIESVISYLLKRFGFRSRAQSNIDAFRARVAAYYPRLSITHDGVGFIIRFDGIAVDNNDFGMLYMVTDYIQQASLNSLNMPIVMPTDDPDYIELKGMSINSGTKTAAFLLCKNLVLKYGLDAMPVSEIDLSDPSQIFRVSSNEGGLGDLVNEKYSSVVEQLVTTLETIETIESITTLTPSMLVDEEGVEVPPKNSYSIKPFWTTYSVEQTIFQHPVPRPFLCQGISLDMISADKARLSMDFNFLPFLSVHPDVSKSGTSVDYYRNILKNKGIEMLQDIFPTFDVKFLYVESGYSANLNRMKIALGTKDGFLRTKCYESKFTYNNIQMFNGFVPVDPAVAIFNIPIGRKAKVEDPYIIRVSTIYDVVSASFSPATSGNVVSICDALDSRVEEIAVAAALEAVISKMSTYGLHKDNVLVGEIDRALIKLSDLTKFAVISTQYLEAIDSLLDIMEGMEGVDDALIMGLRSNLATTASNMGNPIYYLSYTDSAVSTIGVTEPQTIGHYLFGRQ